jgi:hypothetical protein
MPTLRIKANPELSRAGSDGARAYAHQYLLTAMPAVRNAFIDKGLFRHGTAVVQGRDGVITITRSED